MFNFVSYRSTSVCTKDGIERSLRSVHHPPTNGLEERMMMPFKSEEYKPEIYSFIFTDINILYMIHTF